MRYSGSQVNHDLIANLAFDIPAEHFVSLVGRTAAGKTTLLRMIAGLEARFKGTITLDATRVAGPSRAIQLVFQDFRLLPWKTVRQNIAFAMKRPRDPIELAQVDEWIRIVGLEDQRDAWPKTLSGGEEARVAFARAFVDQPRLLLLDEPFRGLDVFTKYSLQDKLLRALATFSTTVLMVSHSIEDAVFLSDRIHVLSDSPMAIDRTFEIPVPKPRVRGAQVLSDIEREIVQHLSRHSDSRLTGALSDKGPLEASRGAGHLAAGSDHA